MSPVFPEACARFVDYDLNDPGAEFGLMAKLAEGLKSLQDGFLRHFRRIGFIVENREGHAMDRPLVRAHQFVECLWFAA